MSRLRFSDTCLNLKSLCDNKKKIKTAWHYTVTSNKAKRLKGVIALELVIKRIKEWSGRYVGLSALEKVSRTWGRELMEFMASQTLVEIILSISNKALKNLEYFKRTLKKTGDWRIRWKKTTIIVNQHKIKSPIF